MTFTCNGASFEAHTAQELVAGVLAETQRGLHIPGHRYMTVVSCGGANWYRRSYFRSVEAVIDKWFSVVEAVFIQAGGGQ